MHKIALALMCALFGAFLSVAQAQQPPGTDVVTRPLDSAIITNGSSTITSGGTYQQIFAASGFRRGCTVQNNGTHTMFVFFGPIASAMHATSVQLSSGQSVNCQVGGIVVQDQVSIDGTTADSFYAAQQ